PQGVFCRYRMCDIGYTAERQCPPMPRDRMPRCQTGSAICLIIPECFAATDRSTERASRPLLRNWQRLALTPGWTAGRSARVTTLWLRLTRACAPVPQG